MTRCELHFGQVRSGTICGSFDAPTVFAVGEVATALGLVPTGGTDYHGDFGPYAESHAMLWVPPEVAPRLLAAVEEVSPPRARP